MADFIPSAPPAPSSRSGAVSGTVTITVERSPTDASTTSITVTYAGFADQKGWVIDGTESAEYRGGMNGTTTYLADLSIAGDHHGFLRADATISPAGIDGSIDSEVDGQALHLPRS